LSIGMSVFLFSYKKLYRKKRIIPVFGENIIKLKKVEIMRAQINRKVYVLACAAVAAVLVLTFLLFDHYYVKTYTVTEGTIKKSLSGDALVIKKETVVNSPADGKLQILVKPGERVRVGTPLFMVTTDSKQKESLEKQISELQDNIQNLRDTLNSSVPSNVLNKSIDDTTKKLKDAVAGGQFDKVTSLKNELARLTDEKQKQLQSGENNIKALEDSIDELKKKLNSIELLVNAPEAGMVSFSIDGSEGVLTPDSMKTISVSQLQSVENQARKQDVPVTAGINKPVMKIVDNFAWYLAADIGNTEMKTGKNYNIIIKATDFSEEIRAKLVEVSGNNSVGIFMIEKDLPEIMDLRKVNVEIITETVTGYMVPLSGIVEIDGSKGVYLTGGGNRVFQPVKIIAGDDVSAVVEGLKLGDRISIDEKGLTWKH